MIYIRRVGPYTVRPRKPNRRIVKFLLLVSGLVVATLFSFKVLKINLHFQWKDLIELPNKGPEPGLKKQVPLKISSIRAPRGKCGLLRPCPTDDFAFRISSGAANVISSKICFDGEMLVGGMMTFWGPGITIAVINGQTGKLIVADFFDMWSGDVNLLINFLQSIESGSIVLVASSDDPATRLNKEARALFQQLGSSRISTLGFRDSWAFVGGKGIKNLKPMEKHIKNDKLVNKYDNWPEMIEMEGCIPRSLLD